MFSAVAADMLRKCGINVEEAVLDAAACARQLIEHRPIRVGGISFALPCKGLMR